MNKTPHYKQSSIVFFGIGILFLLLSLEIIFSTTWLNYITMSLVLVLIVFAVVSSIFISKKDKQP